MKIFVHQMKPAFPCTVLNYVIQRSARRRLDHIQRLEEFLEICSEHRGVDLPIAPPETHPELSKRARADIEAHERAARKRLLHDFPLLPDEGLQGETFGFFDRPYGGLPKNVPFLRQETTFAVVFFVFTRFRIAKAGLQAVAA